MKDLNLKYPLIVAPMAGGPSSPDLVIASCEAGALGSIGAAYSSPKDIEAFVKKVRNETNRPFAINLFVPHDIEEVAPSKVTKAIQATKKFREELGVPEPKLTPPYEEDFDKQFEKVLELGPAVFSFVFGMLSSHQIQALKDEEIYVIGTATRIEEARLLEDLKVDAITLQGIEAGGHRGIFDAEAEDIEIPTFELLAICKRKIRLPLIAAGGLMTAKDVDRALSAGAEAVQLGTAFLNCQEAGTSRPYREALKGDRRTKTTRAFSGRLARGIENRFIKELKPETILPFPAQNKFTKDLRKASAEKNSADFLSLWSGTGKGELWEGSAQELIARLFPH